jgi:hypothetical protein
MRVERGVVEGPRSTPTRQYISNLSAPSFSRRPWQLSTPEHPKNKSYKYGKNSFVNLLPFPAMFSPQKHHNLPSKNHVLHLKKRKTPSKNTLFPPKK